MHPCAVLIGMTHKPDMTDMHESTSNLTQYLKLITHRADNELNQTLPNLVSSLGIQLSFSLDRRTVKETVRENRALII